MKIRQIFKRLLGKKVESKKAGNNIDDNRVPCKIMEDWYEMERKRGMTIAN